MLSKTKIIHSIQLKQKTILCVGLLVLLFWIQPQALAQSIPAWTRGLNSRTWNSLIRGTTFSSKGKAPFITLFYRQQLPNRVRSTDYKFIYHKIGYSGLFTQLEKNILLKSSDVPTTLGKIAYLHDKHAVFFNQLMKQPIPSLSENAFWQHQKILQELLQGLSVYYQPEEQDLFSSLIFSPREIAYLQEAPAQPTCYVLSTPEINYFANLSSLQQQQQWVKQIVEKLNTQTQDLLTQTTNTITPAEFENYYIKSLRLNYFRMLEQVLEKSSHKRLSAIMRFKLPLEGETQKLTDAQRGGRLQFRVDSKITPELQQQLKNFEERYATYAAAEAMEQPYEIALQYGASAPELLGKEEGKRLRQATPQEIFEEIPPKVQNLEQQLISLRQNPRDTNDFYLAYYRIHTQLQIYRTLLARAHFFDRL